MRNIKDALIDSIGGITIGTIFFCLLILIPYLVGQHYPFNQWTNVEQLIFIILFPTGFVFGFIGCYIGPKLGSLKNSTSTDEGGSVVPQLIELNEIIYPDSNYDFSRLKQKVQKLKLKELEPQLELNKTQLTNLIANLQNRASNDIKGVMDLYLQSHAQMIVQNKENDSYAQAQLINFENALQNHLTQDELKALRTFQKEILVSEQQINNFRENKGKTPKELDIKPIASSSS